MKGEIILWNKQIQHYNIFVFFKVSKFTRKICLLSMDNFKAPETNIPIEDECTKQCNENKAFQMMEKMGYKAGCGLGKFEQGITKVMEITFRLGKKGLGLKLKNMDSTTVSWDFTKEEPNVKQDVMWLQSIENFNFTFEEMLSWIRDGTPDHDIESQCSFCDKEVLLKVLRAKDVFEEFDKVELDRARARSNLFETIKSAIFMNRAALKMANIDAATDYMFTNINKNEYHKNYNGPFYFADVCAGPGGFTEYILWRKKWLFKGFGFTLKGKHDFKVHGSTCASHVGFQALYGKDGDGNIYSPENIKDFKTKVLHETDNQGVHFMMSDGGFSVEGNENLQEIFSKNIYICQCLVALEVIRSRGHFVTKLFDTFTPFSVGLIYLMYKCFDKVAIFKPNTSRPANSERYLICSSLKDPLLIRDIKLYLWNIVSRFWDIKDKSKLDILEIVPLSILKEDRVFYQHIYETNQRLAMKQTIALKKLATFCCNPTLVEEKQKKFHKESLELWDIPPVLEVKVLTVEDVLDKAMKNREMLAVQPREIKNIQNFNSTFVDVEDWRYCPLYSSRNCNNIRFYAALGSARVFYFQGGKWSKENHVQLYRGTLLSGELVKEKVINKTKENEETFKYSLHVIDALRLGEVNLDGLTFNERQKLIEVYCKSMNRELHPKSARIRHKRIDRLSEISAESLYRRIGDENRYLSLPVLGYDCVSEKMAVNSLLFMKSNNNQTFYSTYVLRVQIHIDDDNETNGNEHLSLEDIVSEIKQKV